MCFIVFAYEQHARYRLVMATNRDEFYERPTAPAAFWEDAPGVLAGRDLKAGGTWLGVTRAGQFAALTNYRDLDAHRPDAPTRGRLVSDYLTDTLDPRAYLARVQAEADAYNGFNLLVGDTDALYYFSNQRPGVQRLGPGLYGLSNHVLDTPWPKIKRGKAQLAYLLDAEDVDPDALLDLLSDTAIAPDDDLPDTGIGQAWERVLSSIFIQSPDYGTRASTLVLFDYAGTVTFIERLHGPDVEEATKQTRRYTFEINAGIVEREPYR